MRMSLAGPIVLSLLTVCSAVSAEVEAPDSAAGAIDRVAMADPPSEIGDFELIDQGGNAFSLAELRRRPALVFFGFTHCVDVCPLTLQQLWLVTAAPGASLPGLAVVMISVDGDRDTPARMKSFLAAWSPNFIGLTGDPRLVRRLAARFRAVFFRGLPDDPAGSYEVQHTSQVYLVDAGGRLRATFFDAPPEMIARSTRLLLCGSEQRLPEVPGADPCERSLEPTRPSR